jgi:hypothetical protein
MTGYCLPQHSQRHERDLIMFMALQRKLVDIGDGKMPDGMIPKRFLFQFIGNE